MDNESPLKSKNQSWWIRTESIALNFETNLNLFFDKKKKKKKKLKFVQLCPTCNRIVKTF